MAKNKMDLAFEGFDELMGKYSAIGGDLKKVTEKALTESQKYIAQNAQRAMSKHRRTGKTEESIIRDGKVEWTGSRASIGVGFDVKEGLASIFLMYGTPRVAKDTKLYNAVYGTKTRKETAKIQENILQKAIEERMR